MSESPLGSLDEATALSLGRERRAWVRCSCNLDSSCQPIPMASASQPEMQWHAKVRDLSVGGLNLHVRRRFEAGTPLFIEVPTVMENTLKTLGAVVVHVVQGPEGWIHGCRFEVRLTEEDLNELL